MKVSAAKHVANAPIAVNLVTAIVSGGYCTGCGACADTLDSQSMTMTLSPQGHLRPVPLGSIGSNCNDRLRIVCPGIHLDRADITGPSHPILGPLESTWTGYATDSEIRYRASSGGVLSALALFLIESGRVDFVAQIAASPGNPLVNEVRMSRTRSDVLDAAGSRYAPCAPLARINEFLSSKQRFAVVGKPCDVAAIRNLARLDQRVERQVPYLLSFMCAGVPSIVGTHEILSRMGVAAGDLESFRYRGNGWPGKARAVTRDGRVAEMDYATAWGEVLNRHLQFRCKICPDGTGEFADITCADAWFGLDGYPDFSEKEGRSLVLARSSEGSELLREAVSAGVVKIEPLAVDQIKRMQPYQYRRKQLVLARLLATRIRQGWWPSFRRLGLLRASLGVNPLDLVRDAVGTYRRARGESV